MLCSAELPPRHVRVPVGPNPSPMPRVRRLLPALLVAAAGAGACAYGSEPTTYMPPAPPKLASEYVLRTVSGRALPARYLQLSARVYRVHTDTLRFDTTAATFRESALIGGRDTTATVAESVVPRTAGPLPFTRPAENEVQLANFLGLGRATATIFEGGLTVVAVGQRFQYGRLDRD